MSLVYKTSLSQFLICSCVSIYVRFWHFSLPSSTVLSGLPLSKNLLGYQ